MKKRQLAAIATTGVLLLLTLFDYVHFSGFGVDVYQRLAL
jgi:hypothetical protein